MKEVIAFYENLLALDQMEDEQVMDEIMEDILAILDQHATYDLERETSREEIDAVIFSMNQDKFSGLDVFPVGFYKNVGT